MRKVKNGAFAASLAAFILWPPAHAQHGGGRHIDGGPVHAAPAPGHADFGRQGFGHGDFGYRSPVPYHHVPPAPYWHEHWHDGHWYHGDHDRHHGWWWVVGGGWFWFAEPVYPSPDFYVPPQVVVAVPPSQYWYWCDQPAGYYPYITQCTVPWRAVPVTPDPAPAAPGY